jgi:hypothetical protein
MSWRRLAVAGRLVTANVHTPVHTGFGGNNQNWLWRLAILHQPPGLSPAQGADTRYLAARREVEGDRQVFSSNAGRWPRQHLNTTRPGNCGP